MDEVKRILIVDDEPIPIVSATDFLNAEGYLIDSAFSGKDAWMKLTAEKPDYYDIVLVDYFMPQMSGIELLYKIKSSVSLQNIPVIVNTAFADQSGCFEALEAGATDFIYKPWERDFLLYVVEHAIQDHNELF